MEYVDEMIRQLDAWVANPTTVQFPNLKIPDSSCGNIMFTNQEKKQLVESMQKRKVEIIQRVLISQKDFVVMRGREQVMEVILTKIRAMSEAVENWISTTLWTMKMMTIVVTLLLLGE